MCIPLFQVCVQQSGCQWWDIYNQMFSFMGVVFPWALSLCGVKRCTLTVATSLNCCLFPFFINRDHFKWPFWNPGGKASAQNDRDTLIHFLTLLHGSKPWCSSVAVTCPEGAVVPSDVRRRAAGVSVTLWHVLKPLPLETAPALHGCKWRDWQSRSNSSKYLLKH